MHFWYIMLRVAHVYGIPEYYYCDNSSTALPYQATSSLGTGSAFDTLCLNLNSAQRPSAPIGPVPGPGS